MSGLDALEAKANHSWLEELDADPQTEQHVPNKRSRQVTSGHYVRVLPTPLPKPVLVAFSPAMATELGLSEQDCAGDERFVRFFSGDVAALPSFKSWCTPYALSIYGQEMIRNCPFGNGNGYGDGRAVSVGEAVVDGKRWELQLKGGGTTPFCRGADGRAVLRSSIREFLASEAMHHMGVSTTRALSLVLSKAETVDRPWYTGRQASGYDTDPDTMRQENCAITCRVATSFLRIGHLELFYRRARKGSPEQRAQLEKIARHLLAREYPSCLAGGTSAEAPPDFSQMSVKDLKQECEQRGVSMVGLAEKSEIIEALRAAPAVAPLQPLVMKMLAEMSERLAQLMADWWRVGFCQGNFNSDNCLAGGRTMDYGPFGFMEEYDPAWCMWVGGGGHFAFGNQPVAAMKNFECAVAALSELLDNRGRKDARALVAGFKDVAQAALDQARCRKLGVATAEEASKLWAELDSLMQRSAADYTLLWRRLAHVAEGRDAGLSKDELVSRLGDSFYKPLDDGLKAAWATWLEGLLESHRAAGRGVGEVAAGMRSASPKYVPREWMLVQAYEAAYQGDFGLVQELNGLFARPFDEQPEFEAKYFRLSPAERRKTGGVHFMS